MKTSAYLILLLVVALAGCGGDTAEQKSEMPKAATYLTEKLTDLDITRTAEVSIFEGEALFEHINGGAEIYHQYDFVEVATTYYTFKETELSVDIYRFADADKAFGLYSVLRSDNVERVNLGVDGFISPTSVDFVKGTYMVRIIAYEESDEATQAMSELAKTLATSLTGTTMLPEKFILFPGDNAVPHTETILAASFLGQQFLTDMYTKKYAVAGDTVTLFLTVDSAGVKYAEWAALTGVDTSAAELQSFAFDSGYALKMHNEYRGDILAGLKGGYLAGVVGYKNDLAETLRHWITMLP